VNVGLAITRNRVRWPDADALFGGAGLTNLDLDRRTNQIARTLVEHFGLVKGDRVALLVANRPEVVEVLGGVAKAGLVYVGLNFRLGPVELEQVLENAEPGMVLTDAEHRDQVSDVVDTHGAPVLDIDGTEWLDLVAAASDSPPPSLYDTRADDDFCIVYTSGTTGRPKGILFDHARALQHATVACLEYQIGHDSRYLIQIPHNSSVNITIVPCLVVGAAMGFRDSRSFDPIGFARSVEQDGVTHSFLVPTQLMRLLDRLPTTSDHQLGGLVTLGYGASPISPERLSQLVGRFGPIFNQLYGMAEIASIGTILRKEDHVAGLDGRPELLSSCGQPSYAVAVRVVDENGDDVAVGNRGEVVFAGPHVMKRYFRDPDRTDEVLIDGWMHSGDVAEVSDDGYIFIVDRIKNLIIRGGLNIAPTEIENVLYRHPAVLEAAVVGIPDPEWGEAILAVVALKEGADAGPEELRLHCRTSDLTSIKVPERVEIVDSLPKNAVGKIAKNEIRDRFWGEGRKV
jgi:acyl-CoA synthetase (AMP-forming)/AMP-acid ligase II